MLRLRAKLAAAAAALVVVSSLIAPTSASANARGAAHAAAPAVIQAHPRILLNRADLQALASATESDVTAAALYAPVKERADALLSTGVIRYSKDTGDLQPVSRELLNRVYSLGIVWRVTGDLKYADRLWRDLEAAAGFPDWNPAHFLDTAEIALAFAVSYDWMHGYLSTYKKSVMKTAIETKAFQPALNAYSSGAHWTTTVGNWNVVVNSGLGTAALSFDDLSPALSSQVLEEALQNIQIGLEAYGDDGSFNEGVTYWSYATSYLAIFTSSLETSTRSQQGLLDSPGVALSGQFILRMSGPSGHFANFGDAWSNEAVTVPLLALEALTKDATLRDRSIAALSGPDAVSLAPQSLLWYSKARSSAGTRSALSLDAAFSAFPVATLRGSWSDRMASAIVLKGGTAGQPGHEDLDAGSFTLDALGERWAMDLGADSYKLPGYFSVDTGERWDFYRKRAEGHNRLVVDPGRGADSAVSAAASVSVVRSEPGEANAVTDLTTAYAGGAVTSWRRGVSLFDGRTQALVQDEIVVNGTADVWWFMHTGADIAVSADGRSATLRIRDKAMEVQLLQPSTARFVVSAAKPLWTSPSPPGQDPNPGIWKLAIHLDATESTTVAVQFSPKTSSSTAPLALVRPLASWGEPMESAAVLSEIAVDGVPIVEFSPSKLAYNLQASSVDKPPQVSAKAASGASVSVVQATGTPGRAEITVTSAGKAAAKYFVAFHPGAVTVASVTSSSGHAQALIDRKPYTYWTVQGTQTALFDLGERRTVQHAEIDWRGVPGEFATFKIEVSDNQTAWRQVFEGAVRTHTVNQWSSWTTGALKSRYVRITVHGAGADKTSSISEFHLFSEASYVRTVPKTQRWQASPRNPAVSIDVGDTHDFTYTLTRPTTATADPAQEFFTTDSSVATVSSSGKVTALAPGNVNVGVRFNVAGELVYATSQVTIKNPDVVERTAFRDGYVQGGESWNDYTFRNAQEIFARHSAAHPAYDRVAYLGFDLTGVPAARIISATLSADMRPRSNEASNTHVAAFTVDGAWAEATLTFNNRPRLVDRVGYVAVSGASARRSMDVTDAVRAGAGGAEFTLALSQDAGGVGEALEVAIQSRRTSKPPTLTIQLADDPPAAPQIQSAVSSSQDLPGEVVIGLEGPAEAEVDVVLWSSTSDRCPVSRASGSELASKRVALDASGNASVTMSAEIVPDSLLFATTQDTGGRVSRPSDCARAERAAGVGEVRRYRPSQSGHVEGRGSANIVYNTATNLLVKRTSAYPDFDRYAFMGFDLRDLAGASIESATLEFRAVSASAATHVTAFEVTADWSERNLSFNNRPAFGGRLSRAEVGQVASQVQLDVTDSIRLRAGGDASIGFSKDDPGDDAIITISGHRSAFVPVLTVVLRPYERLAQPEILSAFGKSGGSRGQFEGVARGPAGAGIEVTLFAAGSCVPHRGATREVGRFTVTAGEDGIAQFSVDADVEVEVGETVMSVAASAGPRSSDFAGCTAVTRRPGVSEEVTLQVSADTFVHGGDWANTAFATAAEFQVRSTTAHPAFDRYALLLFDLSSIQGRTVESATLDLGARAASGASHLSVYGIAEAWNRSTVTFNTRPAFGPRQGGVDVSTTLQRRQIDVSSAIANGEAIHGFALGQDGGGPGAGTVVLVDGSRTGRGATLTIRLASAD